MITLTINAENPVDLMSQMAQLMVGATALKEIAANVPAAPAAETKTEQSDDKPARKSRGKKVEEAPAAAEPAAPVAGEGEPENGASEEDVASQDEQSSVAVELTEKSLRDRATRYAQKAGPSALVQLQTEAGAPNGKISQIIGDPERMQRLSAGLEALGY